MIRIVNTRTLGALRVLDAAIGENGRQKAGQALRSLNPEPEAR